MLALAGGAERRRHRPRPGRPPPRRGRLVVRPGAARRRLLVPAQPDRRRQPDPRDRRTSARSACRTPSTCRPPGPTSTSPTTRPTPASGATTSSPASTTPSAGSGRWSSLAALAGGDPGARLGPQPRRALARRRRPLRHARLPLHAAQRRRRRGRTDRLRDQHPLRAAGAARRRSRCCRCRAPSTAAAASGRCSRALLVVLVLTDRSDAVLRDPSRLFGIALAVLLVLIPAGLLALRAAAACPARALAAGFAVLALALVAIGYPVQRDYLDDRFRNDGPRGRMDPGHTTSTPPTAGPRTSRTPASASPGRRPASSSTASTAPTSPTDVVYLGKEGPHGAFNAIPTCRDSARALDDADLDYLVTSPFLNFIHTGEPIPSPEAGWLRGAERPAGDRRARPVVAAAR